MPCDFSVGMLREGKRHRPHLPFTAGDGTRLPFADGAFGLAFAVTSLIDFPAPLPEVDEMVALPLDLYAAEHGLSKITPNLMGF